MELIRHDDATKKRILERAGRLKLAAGAFGSDAILHERLQDMANILHRLGYIGQDAPASLHDRSSDMADEAE